MTIDEHIAALITDACDLICHVDAAAVVDDAVIADVRLMRSDLCSWYGVAPGPVGDDVMDVVAELDELLERLTAAQAHEVTALSA